MSMKFITISLTFCKIKFLEKYNKYIFPSSSFLNFVSFSPI